MEGWNAVSQRQSLRSSSVSRHTPTARPARYAAPSAVVSRMTGRQHGLCQHIRLELHQEAVAACAAVHLQLAQRICP